MPAWTATIIGLLAGALTTASWVPQLFRTWRRRSARDFSWGYLALFSSGVFGWFVYGWMREDVVIVVANLVTLVLVLSVAWVKWREERPR